MLALKEPQKDCGKCSRLKKFRKDNSQLYPNFFNGAVPNFGSVDAEFLIVGLAPGLKGANQTGRPFTGDFAGDLLYTCLLEAGFATGKFENHAGDSLVLKNTLITNAVRCVPPQNKPTPAEAQKCKPFLTSLLKGMTNLKMVLVLGHLAHNATLRALDLTQAHYKFQHGFTHELPGGVLMMNSYHCSRYNVNTGVLTVEMFLEILEKVRQVLTP